MSREISWGNITRTWKWRLRGLELQSPLALATSAILGRSVGGGGMMESLNLSRSQIAGFISSQSQNKDPVNGGVAQHRSFISSLKFKRC